MGERAREREREREKFHCFLNFETEIRLSSMIWKPGQIHSMLSQCQLVLILVIQFILLFVFVLL